MSVESSQPESLRRDSTISRAPLPDISAEREAAASFDAALRQAVAWVTGETIPHVTNLNGDFDLALAVRAAGFALRPIRLRGTWWRGTGEPLVAFRGVDGHPIALLVQGGGLVLRDPVTGEQTRMTPALTRDIALEAVTFYRTLPDRVVGLRDVLRLGWLAVRGDVARLIGVGIAAGLISLAVPLISAALFEVIIPDAAHSKLLVIALVLLLSAVSLALFEVSRGWLLVRIGARLDLAIQGAVWHRLFNLPVEVLTGFQAGDLAERANGIKAMKQWLSSTIVTTILAILFVGFNFALMLAYQPLLTGAAFLLTAIAVGVNLLLGAQSQRSQRRVTALNGLITSLVLFILEGIAKLQVARAIPHALARWREDFYAQRQHLVRARTLMNVLLTFNGSYPIFAALVVFALTAQYTTLDAGRFLAFNLAFTQVMTTFLAWSGAILAALGALPYYERLKPLLDSPPETDRSKLAPPRLTGAVQIDHVSFRYGRDGGWILRDVSLDVAPGTMVAIVGAVGSGKSTLLRLLLGFETPTDGDIRYDEVPLRQLDLPLLRRQLGVVLQNAHLPAGTLLSTIANIHAVTVDRAWDACHLAALDAEIQQMPMRLDTYLSEGGTNLSGGQVQRLLLARALAHGPRVLLLDEATSALDDELQDTIMKNLRALGITCIFIAHRMETIAYADVVYELREGSLQRAERGNTDPGRLDQHTR